MQNERVNLTPGYCKDLPTKDKRYFVKDYNCQKNKLLRDYKNQFKLD